MMGQFIDISIQGQPQPGWTLGKSSLLTSYKCARGYWFLLHNKEVNKQREERENSEK